MTDCKILGGYKNIRLRNYNYHTGWFFITNKTNFGKPYFQGKIYELVKKELENLKNDSSGVALDYAIIVPSHVHAILIFENSHFSLSDIWRRFKARTTFLAKKMNLLKDKTLWQRNYFEHIIRNEKALEKIREYLKNNPLKENLPLDEIYGNK